MPVVEAGAGLSLDRTESESEWSADPAVRDGPKTC